MTEELPVTSDYDYENDVLFVRATETDYHESLSVDKDLILDLNENGDIIGFEILNASNAFNIPQAHLQQLEGTYGEITVTEEKLRLNISIKTAARNNLQQRGTYNVNNQRPTALRAQNQSLATT